MLAEPVTAEQAAARVPTPLEGGRRRRFDAVVWKLAADLATQPTEALAAIGSSDLLRVCCAMLDAGARP